MKTNMTRTHGRFPRGQRLIAKIPHGTSPAFATRGQESLKQSVFRGVVSQGRHHTVDGHYVPGIPSVVILGGGLPLIHLGQLQIECPKLRWVAAVKFDRNR
jgi:hypothetical protein